VLIWRKRNGSMGHRDEPRRYSILSIAPTSFFYDYGCHVRILEETLALQKLGHRVTICTYNSGNGVDGLDIYRTPPIPWRKGVEVGSSRHKIAFDALLSVTALACAGRCRPDIIHAHLHEGALIGAVAGGLARAPVVFDFQGSLTGEMVDHRFLSASSHAFRWWRQVERAIDRLPSAIITSTGNAVKLLTNDFECAPQKVHIVPDGVNPDVFLPRWQEEDGYDPYDMFVLRSRLGIPRRRKVVVYIGLLAEHQGTPHLLQAAASVVQRLPDVHFLIMGFPNVEGYVLQARALGLEGNVSFPGRIPYGKLPLYLALGDVAVNPKVSLTEGAGKLLNYMALGLPVVSFDTPVAREYLRGDGVYAPLGDAAAFADALVGLLRAPEQQAAIGRALRERAVAEYSWQAMGEKIVAVYGKLLAGKSRRLDN
jgi:glycosyltransferase involved in cell wall biosynthesis